MKTVEISVVKFRDCWALSADSIWNLRFDGKEAKKNFSGWYFIDPDPKTVVTEVFPDKRGEKRYILKDAFKKMAAPSFPSELIPEEVETGKCDTDDDGDTYYSVWKEEFQHLKPMYEVKYDVIPGGEEEVEPDYSVKAVVDVDYRDPKGVKFHTGKNRDLTDYDVVKPTLVESVMFPEVVTKSFGKASLTSGQMYSVVREHVKNNIDPKHAFVSSDYDFCFAVTKRVQLARPRTEQQSYYPTLKSKRAKIREVTVTQRNFTVFSMTNDKSKWKDYNVIPGIEAENIFDLKKKVDRLLEDLMKVINAPIADCPHCSGYGVVFDGEVDFAEWMRAAGAEDE